MVKLILRAGTGKNRCLHTELCHAEEWKGKWRDDDATPLGVLWNMQKEKDWMLLI